MSSVPRPLTLSCLGAIACMALIAATPARAGCGCDHPPPAWTSVMPPFGSAGATIQLMADDSALEIGALYEVDFGDSARIKVRATHTDRLAVDLPAAVPPGPVAIRLSGPGVELFYPDDLFTALPRARRIQEREGVYAARNYDAAVGADGTLYLALDASRVLDPMQFTFALHGIALHFEHDDVVIYNADGVDLTLFTLDVEDGSDRQWGSYYGWSVESDHGLRNLYYLPQVAHPHDADAVSSVFTYWRHEFHTYAEAHEPGGSHEVDEQGLHPDGTLHIDHDSLIIAIRGVERDADDPLDLSKATALPPGEREVDVAWLSVATEQPVELPSLSPEVTEGVRPDHEELVEVDAQ